MAKCNNLPLSPGLHRIKNTCIKTFVLGSGDCSRDKARDNNCFGGAGGCRKRGPNSTYFIWAPRNNWPALFHFLTSKKPCNFQVQPARDFRKGFYKFSPSLLSWLHRLKKKKKRPDGRHTSRAYSKYGFCNLSVNGHLIHPIKSTLSPAFHIPIGFLVQSKLGMVAMSFFP